MSPPPSLGGPRPGWHRFWKPASPQTFPARSSVMSIFAFPNRSGIAWLLVCVVVLAWSLNASNNAGVLLGCALAVAWFYAGLMPAGRLMGLSLLGVSSESSFEGSTAVLRLRFKSRRRPDGLMVEFANSFAPIVFSGDTGQALLSVPTTSRGIYAWPVIRVTTRRPFGVSSSWVRFWPSGDVVVWPVAEKTDIPCPGRNGELISNLDGSKRQTTSKAEEWSHLREYRRGDRWRDIDWKRVARTGEYWVRQFDHQPGGKVEINWQATEGLPLETRVRRLAKWLADAERAGQQSLLVLPHKTLGPDFGISHRSACLTALAEVPSE
jgi:uncharacterized protein (DUF58 family)